MKLDPSLWPTLFTQSDLPKAAILPFPLYSPFVIPLDLSAKNAGLLKTNIKDTSSFTAYVFSKIEKAGAVAAIGGYNEDRIIYARSGHFSGEEPRTIHLGVDIWALAGTPIFAPLPGKIHSFQNNNNFGDYGPTLILQHQLSNYTFYSLYGHLSRRSLHTLYEGKNVEAGEQIGNIGPYPENGDWPPHLHFQIITDMLGLKGDFPGVAAPSQRAFYLSICPDPTLLLALQQTE